MTFPTPGTILLVEDMPLIREMTQEMLEDDGYHVLAVENATEALAILNSAHPISVLFSDVVLPGELDGLQLAEEARRLQGPSLRVVLTSGNPLPEGVSGIAAFLLKPYRMQQMLGTIRDCLAAKPTS